MSPSGVVTSFDEHVGLGLITANDGTEYPFHCTQIANGTRTIALGAAVTFTIEKNRPKGPEAYALAPAPEQLPCHD